MPRVFILGGAGYIGSHVALAFRRAGFHVDALIRPTSTRKTWLLQNEIRPHEGDAAQVSTWLSMAKHADVVVQAATDSTHGQIDNLVADTLLALKQEHPKVKIITTGGTWVFGSGPGKTETSSLDNAHPALGGRVALLKKWQAGGGIVVHPVMVFGYESRPLSIPAEYIRAALKGDTTVSVLGKPGKTMNVIHASDLGTAFVAAAQKGRDGAVYNASGDAHPVEEIVNAVYAAARLPHPELKFVDPAPGNIWEELLAISQTVSSEQTRSELGWTPHLSNYVAQAHETVAAYKAFGDAMKL